MNEWIPIKYNKETMRFEGKVPEDWQRVLVSTSEPTLEEMDKSVYICRFRDAETSHIFDMREDLITAWMPLPEPYNEKNGSTNF